MSSSSHATPSWRDFDVDTELEGYRRMNTKNETARLRDRPLADTASNRMLTPLLLRRVQDPSS
jgi:hypothetical protein